MNCNKRDALNYQLNITYTNHEDKLKDSHPLFNKTMEDRPNPRPPCSFVMGNRVLIELSSPNRYGRQKLNNLVSYLCETEMRGNVEELDFSGIVYSITGDLPLSYRVNKLFLTRENLNSLIQFTNKEFYFDLRMRKLLQISTKSINLREYFRPLFEKMIEMRTLVNNNHNGYFKSLIDSSIIAILKRVELAAVNINEGNDYQDHLTYLENVYSSFILNKREMSAYMDELMSLIRKEKIKSEIGQSYNQPQQFRQNWEVTFQLKVKISFRKAFQSLENNLNVAFNCDELQVNKSLLTMKFQDEINKELEKLKAHIEDKMSAQQSHQQLIKKNIQVKILVDISMSSDESSVDVCSLKNNVAMKPAYPLLTVAKNIRMIESTETSLSIEWDFEDDTHVTSYKVHYRCVSDRTSTEFHSVNSDNKRARIPNIAAGKYVFRIQAYFNDVLGAPSKESEPFEVLPNNNEWECKICMNEKNNFVFIPCGHTIGEKCVEEFVNNCPFCRKPIERKIKLFNS